MLSRCNLFVIPILLIFSSCRTLGGFGGFPVGGGNTGSGQHNSANSPLQAVSLSLRLAADHVLISDIADEKQLEKCTSKGEISVMSSGLVIQHVAEQNLQQKALEIEADHLVMMPKTHSDTFMHNFRAQAYQCNYPRKHARDIAKDYIKSHRHDDLDLFVGGYFHRHGILSQLGEMGPTLGFSYSKYDAINPVLPVGFFVLWTFDHFWRTNSNLLEPELINKNFTNYMLGLGLAFRWMPHRLFQFHYKGGFAFNFIEIDSFGGDPQKNDEYTDLTVSTIHKLGVDILLENHSNITTDYRQRLGLSVLYYLAPDPMGKFTNDSHQRTAGGSWAWSIDWKFEIY